MALQPIEDGRLGAWGFVHLGCVGAYAGIKPSLERLTRYSELSPDESAEIGAVLTALPVPDPSLVTADDDAAETEATGASAPSSNAES